MDTMARWGHARPAAEYGRAEGRLVVLGGFAQRAEVEREQVVVSCLTSITGAAPNSLAPASALGGALFSRHVLADRPM